MTNKSVSNIEKEKCCGCSACQQACTANAIQMVVDEQGFLYPLVDAKRCNNCGVCFQVCNFTKQLDHNRKVLNAYAFRHKSRKIRLKSSSGGAFVALSDYILGQGGIVCGAVVESGTMYLHHICSKSYEQRNRMCGSKYIQSNLENVYSEIKKYLVQDVKVLFTGTPCQVSGLLGYLGPASTSNNLYTMDIFCHGVPSFNVFKKHLAYLEKKLGRRISCYQFRDKKYGWNLQTQTAILDNGDIKSNGFVQKFKQAFLGNMVLRPACYKCKYASLHRYGDFSVGDFWGVEQILNVFDNNGVSIVLCNTEKGKRFFNKASITHYVDEVNLSSIKQSALERCVEKPKESEKFWLNITHQGYEQTMDKFYPGNIRVKLSRRIHIILRTLGIDRTVLWFMAKIKKHRQR